MAAKVVIIFADHCITHKELIICVLYSSPVISIPLCSTISRSTKTLITSGNRSFQLKIQKVFSIVAFS